MSSDQSPESMGITRRVPRPAFLLLVFGSLLLWNARRPHRPIADVSHAAPNAIALQEAPSPQAIHSPSVTESRSPSQPAAISQPAAFVNEDLVRQAAERLDAARAELLRAEEHRSALESALKQAQTDLAAASIQQKALDRRLRDHRAALQSALARIQSEKQAIDLLKAEIQALAEAPGPRRRPLVDRSPVARPPHGDEFHFEIQNSRIAFIDLERLIDRVKSDAMVQLRLAERSPVIRGEVGPVGDFAIRYQIARGGLDDLIASSVTVTLTGWEIVPIRDTRGETFEQAMDVASDLSRVLARMNPERDAVTIWVYPDGFPLFRRLRDALAARGVLVAARPLPQGIPIRGSPVGSISAVQ